MHKGWRERSCDGGTEPGAARYNLNSSIAPERGFIWVGQGVDHR